MQQAQIGPETPAACAHAELEAEVVDPVRAAPRSDAPTGAPAAAAAVAATIDAAADPAAAPLIALVATAAPLAPAAPALAASPVEMPAAARATTAAPAEWAALMAAIAPDASAARVPAAAPMEQPVALGCGAAAALGVGGALGAAVEAAVREAIEVSAPLAPATTLGFWAQPSKGLCLTGLPGGGGMSGDAAYWRSTRWGGVDGGGTGDAAGMLTLGGQEGEWTPPPTPVRTPWVSSPVRREPVQWTPEKATRSDAAPNPTHAVPTAQDKSADAWLSLVQAMQVLNGAPPAARELAFGALQRALAARMGWSGVAGDYCVGPPAQALAQPPAQPWDAWGTAAHGEVAVARNVSFSQIQRRERQGADPHGRGSGLEDTRLGACQPAPPKHRRRAWARLRAPGEPPPPDAEATSKATPPRRPLRVAWRMRHEQGDGASTVARSLEEVHKKSVNARAEIRAKANQARLADRNASRFQ